MKLPGHQDILVHVLKANGEAVKRSVVLSLYDPTLQAGS